MELPEACAENMAACTPAATLTWKYFMSLPLASHWGDLILWFRAAAREAGNRPWLGIDSQHDSALSCLPCRLICNTIGVMETEGGCLHGGIFLAEAGGFCEKWQVLSVSSTAHGPLSLRH